jgi:hypothetical protein
VLSVHSSASRPQSIARGAAATSAAAAAGSSDVVREGEPPIDEKLLKRFIHYARTHCFPRLEEASAGRLTAKFVELRDKVCAADTETLQCPHWQHLETHRVEVPCLPVVSSVVGCGDRAGITLSYLCRWTCDRVIGLTVG